MRKNNIEVALFGACRNENLYIEEWINHYLNLGVDHIYLVDNSSDNSLESICNNYKENVSIIDLRQKEKMYRFVDYQPTLYTSLYNIYQIKYDWLCFFDIDEFLMLNKDNNIKDYLNRDIFSNIDQIHVTWLTFGDNENIYYENKPVVERFTSISNKYYDIYKEHAFGVKTILHNGLDLHFQTCHTAVSNTDIPLRTSDGTGYLYDQSYSTHDYGGYELSQLNHYETKSTEEFINKNVVDNIDSSIQKYFQINEYSDEKQAILNKMHEIYNKP